MIERDKGRRYKTHRRFVEGVETAVDVSAWPSRGDRVRIVDGAFEGLVGEIVDVDGEWVTVEVSP